MLKKKKIILATGCSFTDPNFKSMLKHLPDEQRSGWPLWPELLQRKIEKETGESYELINLARSGAGNDWVFDRCLDAISEHGNKIKIVLVGGTQWQRTQITATGVNANPQIALKLRGEGKGDSFEAKNQTEDWQKWHNESVVQMWSKYSNEFAMKNVIYHNVRIMWTLLNICNNNNIKFIWNQLLAPISYIGHWRKLLEEAAVIPIEDMNINDQAFQEPFFSDTILKSPYAKQLVKHKKQFYGFTWSHGKFWNLFDSRESPLIILPPATIDGKQQQDLHPNKLGQESIAEEMWKVYGNYLVKN